MRWDIFVNSNLVHASLLQIFQDLKFASSTVNLPFVLAFGSGAKVRCDHFAAGSGFGEL